MLALPALSVEHVACSVKASQPAPALPAAARERVTLQTNHCYAIITCAGRLDAAKAMLMQQPWQALPGVQHCCLRALLLSAHEARQSGSDVMQAPTLSSARAGTSGQVPARCCCSSSSKHSWWLSLPAISNIGCLWRSGRAWASHAVPPPATPQAIPGVHK